MRGPAISIAIVFLVALGCGDSGDDGTSASGSVSTTGGTETEASGTETGSTSAGTGSQTGGQGECGWGADPNTGRERYICGGDGPDPSGDNPFDCPPDAMIGGECGRITVFGCCDRDGNVLWCAVSDDGNEMFVSEITCS